MKRIIAFLLTLTLVFNINVKTIRADQVVHSDIDLLVEDVETYLLPVAIPASQAVVYLLTALGVIGTSSAIYVNRDSIEEWGNKQIESFKVKALALGLTSELVDDWLNDLSSGVLRKSSEVWGVFKTWISGLRSSVISSTPSNGYKGVITAGQTYDITSAFNGAFEYFKIQTYFDGYMYVRPSASGSGLLSSLYVMFQTDTDSNSSGWYYIDYKPSNGTAYSKKITLLANKISSNVGQVYYRSHDLLSFGVYQTDSMLSYFPVINDTVANVFPMLYNGTYEPVISTPDYTIVGGITDFDNVNIGNPSNVSGDTVSIDWGNFDTVGVITGVGTGSMTWDDYLTAGGIVVTEDDIVIGGSDIVEEVPDTPVIEWPEVELGNLSDYTLDLTNIFPFCLPFDFIDFLNILSAEPETPYFEYDMPLPMGGSYKFVIDLSPFDNAAALMRKMETLAFIIGLVFITREKMIRG